MPDADRIETTTEPAPETATQPAAAATAEVAAAPADSAVASTTDVTADAAAQPATEVTTPAAPSDVVRRGKWLALSLAVVATVLVAALMSVQPVTVTVNGVPHKARRNETLRTFVARVDPGVLTSGDLVDVEGEVLKEGGGAPAKLTTNGREIASEETVGSTRAVYVFAGEDIVESTEVRLAWKHFSFKRQGSGPIPVLVDPGYVAPTEITVGADSGKEVSRRDAGESREPVVRYAAAPRRAGKLVALTFDDGPNSGETQQILRILKRERVKATFFVLGKNIEENPGLVARAAAEGHQIAMHSYSHPSFTKLTPTQISAELDRCADAVEVETGSRPKWVRPPYGAVDGLVYNQLDADGYRIALWTVDPRDYSKPGMQKIINRVVFNAYPGMVVLMHDGGGNRTDTVRALPGIIGELRDAGYRFVTIEEYAAAAGL